MVQFILFDTLQSMYTAPGPCKRWSSAKHVLCGSSVFKTFFSNHEFLSTKYSLFTWRISPGRCGWMWLWSYPTSPSPSPAPSTSTSTSSSIDPSGGRVWVSLEASSVTSPRHQSGWQGFKPNDQIISANFRLYKHAHITGIFNQCTLGKPSLKKKCNIFYPQV